jgi:hypothetical protein
MQSDPGIRVTGYRVEARIGRGGMGEVDGLLYIAMRYV